VILLSGTFGSFKYLQYKEVRGISKIWLVCILPNNNQTSILPFIHV